MFSAPKAHHILRILILRLLCQNANKCCLSDRREVIGQRMISSKSGSQILSDNDDDDEEQSNQNIRLLRLEIQRLRVENLRLQQIVVELHRVLQHITGGDDRN